jgi:hypothetical protein
MLLLPLALLSDDVQATQNRLDKLVHVCAAEAVVRLIAQSSTNVIIDMKRVDRAPSSDENRRFKCVLKGMRRMTDLQFGFIGNEAYDGENIPAVK